MPEPIIVRFVVDPAALKELGIDPQTVLGRTGADQSGEPGRAESAGLGKSPGGGAPSIIGGAAIAGVLVGGLLGIVGLFTNLLANSKVLNTYAQGIGKVFSAAIDILLIPFLPVLNLMLAGMLKLVAWLIDSGYLQAMSDIVNTQVVPLLQAAGAFVGQILAAMKGSLDPTKWDWAKISRMFLGDLLINVAMIVSLYEGIVNGGLKLLGLPGIDTTGKAPRTLFEEGVAGVTGKDIGMISPEEFVKYRHQWEASLIAGGLASTVVPGVGTALGTVGGGLIGGGGIGMEAARAHQAVSSPGQTAVKATVSITGLNAQQAAIEAARKQKASESTSTWRGLYAN